MRKLQCCLIIIILLRPVKTARIIFFEASLIFYLKKLLRHANEKFYKMTHCDQMQTR